MNYWLVLFVISFLGCVAILAWRLRLLKDAESYAVKNVNSAANFFVGYAQGGLTTVFCFANKVFFHSKIKNGFKGVSNYMQGRKPILKNGCKGYWKKLDGVIKKDKPM